MCGAPLSLPPSSASQSSRRSSVAPHSPAEPSGAGGSDAGGRLQLLCPHPVLHRSNCRVKRGRVPGVVCWQECVCALTQRGAHTRSHTSAGLGHQRSSHGAILPRTDSRGILDCGSKSQRAEDEQRGVLLSLSRRPAQAALVSQDRLDSTLAWILSSFPSAVEFASGCVKVTFSEVFHIFSLFKHS